MKQRPELEKALQAVGAAKQDAPVRSATLVATDASHVARSSDELMS